MQPIAFCSRCRGMRVGWNRRYMMHCLICKEWISKSSKLLILTVLIAILLFASQNPGNLVFSDLSPAESLERPVVEASVVPVLVSPAVTTIETFLGRYKVEDANRGRIADAIVASSRKYNLDPRLVASIMIVESRANPFAISPSDSIGIMQIHLPTWGPTADKENINLFKIEDNVDLGVRILKDYVRRFGMWEGVKRYKGWNSESEHSTQNVEEYLQKVQRIYGFENPATPPAVVAAQ